MTKPPEKNSSVCLWAWQRHNQVDRQSSSS